MKRLTSLIFLLWFAPLVALQASNTSFWSRMRIGGAFYIKRDSYKVHTNGMHPRRQEGEMVVNGDPIDGTTMQVYRIRWYHTPSIYFDRDKDQEDPEQNSYDPKGIFGFTGRGTTLAAQLLLTMDLERLRIGGGAGIQWSFLKEMVGQWIHNSLLNNDDHTNHAPLSYIPPRSYYFTWNPLVRLGFKLIENQNYTLLIDTTWTPAIYHFFEFGKGGYWIYGRTGDVGATWEKQLTPYLQWSLRVAYGFCSDNEVVEAYAPSSLDHFLSVSHYIDGIIAQVGMNLCLPGLSKCPIMGCHTNIDHTHGGKQYRGN